MLGAILVRGLIGARRDVRETVQRLGLTRKNGLVLLEDTPSIRGMLKKVAAYVTYGPVQDALARELVENFGEPCTHLQPRFPGMRVKETPCREYYGQRIKPVIRLQPPRGGWEQGGIKKLYTQGGALGERPAEAMEALIRRMLPPQKRGTHVSD